MRMGKMIVCAALFAGCASEGELGGKDDVSELPATSARDSRSAPIDGGKMLVGRYESGAFTAERGWIGHEIELTAGAVDMVAHGQNATLSAPQDTVLYVF